MSEKTTDKTILNIVNALFVASNAAKNLGIDFSEIDAIGARVSGAVGGIGLIGGSVDGILNITSGEFSIFGSLQGGLMAGASAKIVGGITLIKNMPSNERYRGTSKAYGGIGGMGVGVNLEKFSGGTHYFEDESDVPKGIFVGVGIPIGSPFGGGYAELSYAIEILKVDQTGSNSFPGYSGGFQTFRDGIFDVGEVLTHDIFCAP